MNILFKLCLSVVVLPLLMPSAAVVSPRESVVFPNVVVIPPKPTWPRTITLAWDYQFEAIMDIEFEVWEQTNATMPRPHWEIVDDTAPRPLLRLAVDPMIISTNWSLRTNTPNQFVDIKANKPNSLFAVRARDKRTGKVSGWATK